MEPNIPFSEASPVNEPLSAAERLVEELLQARSAELPAVPRSLRRNVLGAATRAEAARQAWKWRVLWLTAAGALVCGTFVRIAVLEARRLRLKSNQYYPSGPVLNSFPQSTFPVVPDPTPPQPPPAPDFVSPPVNGPIPDSAGPGEANPSREVPGNLADQPASETAPAKPQPPATPDPAKSEAVPDEVPRPVDPRQGPILGQFDTDTAPLEEAFRQRREKLALLTQLNSAR
jgi:hypothetical protein